jgi:hypothetical protein
MSVSPKESASVGAPSLEGLPVDDLASDDSIIYVLDGDLRLVYCNPAWDKFADDNGGDALRWDAPRGNRLLDAVAEPLRPFYEQGFRSVAETGQPWEHDFECSGPDLFRCYHMQVKRIDGPGGFLVVNSLRVEQRHEPTRDPTQPDPSRYVSAEGFVTMCCHCRRTRRVGESQSWDWVPRFLKDPPAQISHGLCPACVAYHYSWELSR